MDFDSLVGHISFVHNALQAQAAHAVNLSLTARNWLVGYYIVEFEQNGEDSGMDKPSIWRTMSAKLDEKIIRELVCKQILLATTFRRRYTKLSIENISEEDFQEMNN